MMGRRTHGDWVPCEQWGSVVTWNNDPDFATFLLVSPGGHVSEGGENLSAGRMEAFEAIRTLRVIGQFDVSVDAAAANGYLRVAMRIHVGIFDIDGNLAAFEETALLGADEANQPFLWQRVLHYHEAAPSNMIVDVDPWYHSIDVQVARRIDQGQGLFFSFSGASSVGNVVRLTPYLRTYCEPAY